MFTRTIILTILFFVYLHLSAQQDVEIQMFNALQQQNLTQYLNVIEYKQTDTCRLMQLQLLQPTAAEAWATWLALDTMFLNRKGFHFADYLFFLYANVVKDKHLDRLCLQVQENYAPDARVQIFIRFDTAKRKVIAFMPQNLGNLMAATGKISLDNNVLTVRGFRLNIRDDNQRRQLFKRLYDHYYNVYKRQGGLHRLSEKHKIYIDRQRLTADELVFTVRGLKQEVLNQGDDWTCWLLKLIYDFNTCGPYEYLKIRIFYNRQSQSLDYSIDGRFSAGYDRVLSWDNAANMEPAYTTQLKAYADNVFREDLKKFLNIK